MGVIAVMSDYVMGVCTAVLYLECARKLLLATDVPEGSSGSSQSLAIASPLPESSRVSSIIHFARYKSSSAGWSRSN